MGNKYTKKESWIYSFTIESIKHLLTIIQILNYLRIALLNLLDTALDGLINVFDFLDFPNIQNEDALN